MPFKARGSGNYASLHVYITMQILKKMNSILYFIWRRRWQQCIRWQKINRQWLAHPFRRLLIYKTAWRTSHWFQLLYIIWRQRC